MKYFVLIMTKAQMGACSHGSTAAGGKDVSVVIRSNDLSVKVCFMSFITELGRKLIFLVSRISNDVYFCHSNNASL